jgi:Tetratricopeptide repeat
MHVLRPHRQVEERSCRHLPPQFKRCVLDSYNQVHMNILKLLADIPYPEFSVLQQLSEYLKHRLRMGPTQPLTPRNLARTRQPRYDLLQRRAVALARKQDFVAASRCFEALLQHQPGSEKAWISYAQVCSTRFYRLTGLETSRLL